MTGEPTLGELVEVLDELYDPRSAQDWDAVGLVCGDPADRVRKVLFAVDPVAAVADEALAWGADLLVTHHPLLLRPVHGVPATTPKGRLVHRLITGGCGLHVVHTNADAARPGVSDALADAVGIRDTVPLDPLPDDPTDKLVVFVPPADAAALLDALSAAGAGVIGAYERCAWSVEGHGTFRPLPGASPTIGRVGAVAEVTETRLEVELPRRSRREVLAAARAAHPYEEPAIDVYERASVPGTRGIGRVGRTDPLPLSAFLRRVAAALPPTATGVRAAGDPDRLVRLVAVCGGAGDAYLDAVRAARVDAYVTADLRHHPATEAVAHDGAPALVDVAHWASEWPWLRIAADRLIGALTERGSVGRGTTVETRVSARCTDAWTLAESTPDRSSR